MISKTETRRDSAGKEVTEQKYNHLAAAEMTGEDNYNQIDGIANNTSKPTFEERMKDAENKAKEYNDHESDKRKKSKHSNKSECR